MLDFFHQLFGHVCGQYFAHTWSPGGELLPCCQRCTGVYVGAFVAVLLHFVRRPPSTSFWYQLNGVFLLLMIPAGFHWFAQGPELRAASGILFGFGLVAFLWLPLDRNIVPASARKNSRARLGISFVALVAVIVGTPLLGASDSSIAAPMLALTTAGGALVLALLLAANLFLAVRGFSRWWPAARVAA